jgi:hypothetical protein
MREQMGLLISAASLATPFAKDFVDVALELFALLEEVGLIFFLDQLRAEVVDTVMAVYTI